MKLYFIPPFLIQLVVRPITRVLMKFFCRTQIYGLENLNNLPQKLIVAANHIHELDPLVAPSVLPLSKLPSPIFFVSRPTNYYQDMGLRARLFYGGTLFKLMGAYPAFKGTGDYAQSLHHHIKILNDGGRVFIFPEGKRTLDGQMGSARGGVAFLSAITKTPILPIYIDGLWQMNFKSFLLKRNKFKVYIGKVVSPTSLPESQEETESHYKQSAQNLLDIINLLGSDKLER